MKKILLTLATLFSSHLFAAGNPEALRGRFQVNAARCKGFQQATPTRAFVSTPNSNSLVIEFIGSEARQILVRTEDGEDMGRNGREGFMARWSGDTTMVSTRNYVKENGKRCLEVTTIQSTPAGLIVDVNVDGRPDLNCELNRNR